VSLNDLLSQSDIVSLHIPLTVKTEGIVNEAFLQRMNPTAVLINTAHSGLVVDPDLAQHLEDNKSFHYATDTFEDEPDSSQKWSNSISNHSRVHGSHHCGALTKQAFKA
jgi:phosphoglycerate dehydrogenase-like enzyme